MNPVMMVESIVSAAVHSSSSSSTPGRLRWAPDIPECFADIGGIKLRYITVGSGTPLLLLHTLRTQLDIFEGVIPALAKQFAVYALDYPNDSFQRNVRPAVDAAVARGAYRILCRYGNVIAYERTGAR